MLLFFFFYHRSSHLCCCSLLKLWLIYSHLSIKKSPHEVGLQVLTTQQGIWHNPVGAPFIFISDASPRGNIQKFVIVMENATVSHSLPLSFKLCPCVWGWGDRRLDVTSAGKQTPAKKGLLTLKTLSGERLNQVSDCIWSHCSRDIVPGVALNLSLGCYVFHWQAVTDRPANCSQIWPKDKWLPNQGLCWEGILFVLSLRFLSLSMGLYSLT